jgi:hypothetical protein
LPTQKFFVLGGRERLEGRAGGDSQRDVGRLSRPGFTTMNGTLKTLTNFATKCDKEMTGSNPRNAEKCPFYADFCW